MKAGRVIGIPNPIVSALRQSRVEQQPGSDGVCRVSKAAGKCLMAGIDSPFGVSSIDEMEPFPWKVIGE